MDMHLGEQSVYLEALPVANEGFCMVQRIEVDLDQPVFQRFYFKLETSTVQFWARRPIGFAKRKAQDKSSLLLSV